MDFGLLASCERLIEDARFTAFDNLDYGIKGDCSTITRSGDSPRAPRLTFSRGSHGRIRSVSPGALVSLIPDYREVAKDKI
jgi:hypothetical protein